MNQPVPRRALFLCDGAARPPDLADPAWGDPIAISTRGDDPELSLVLEGLARKVLGEVDPRARDLIRIAACCYAADLRVRRGGVDVHRERWRRELALGIPVAEPEFWADPDVVARLSEALGFGTEDAWTFRFAPEQRGDGGQLRVVWAKDPPRIELNTVVLASGGADSLCALVDALRHGANPVVVSHWPAQHIRSRQDTLLRAVKGRFDRWEVPHASFEIHRRGKQPVESSQRTRGFLYAALGAAIAAHHGVGEVRLADNGYVSVNPPITAELVGALASRGTHPKFLHLVNRLLERVFPGVRVVNPLWNRTRAQALRSLAEAECADLLAHTYSCGKQQGHHKGRPLCGGCSQCVDRRVAVIAAGLEAYDPVARYELDLFRGELPAGEPRTVALDFVRLAWETRGLAPRALYDRLPQLDDCLVPDDPDFAATEASIARVLLDHAEETMAVVEAMTTRLSADLATHRLPATSLLPLWIGSPTAVAQVGTSPATGAPMATGLPTVINARQDAERFGVKESGDSTFARAGGVWLVAFRGQKEHYKHGKGMMQLAHLLENPRRMLDVVALSDCRAVDATDQLNSGGVEAWTGGATDPILDDDAIADYKRYLTDLPGLIANARAVGHTDEVKRLRETGRLAKSQLRAVRGLGGRPRQFAEDQEKARKRVSHNVRECYALLAAKMSLFVAHAERFVHLGIPPHYDPDPLERWTVRR